MANNFTNIVLLLFLHLMQQKIFAAASDAEAIIKRLDGRYDIKCNNGSREIATGQQLDSGEICLTGNSNGRFQIKCEGSTRIVYPVHASSGRKYGSAMTPPECNKVSQAAINGVLCSQKGNGNWFLTRMTDGHTLGTHGDFESCLVASVFTRQSISCVPQSAGWNIINIVTELPIGRRMDESECFQVLRTAREGVVCSDVGGDHWSVSRIADDVAIGNPSTLQRCIYATDNAYAKKVCVHVGADRWQGVETNTETAITDVMSLEACITQL